ncbi:hypothetical protein [Phycicoccus avicenniae]|uniref:hypothetical protein n=1 Tax=Phycicoccus avicenniae TaxID=2828860 RepID=UPI003D2E64CC
MGTIPTFPTFADGEIPNAAKLNQMKTASDFWALTPRCSVFPSAPQTLSHTVWGLIGFNSEVYDIVQSGDTPSHDTATNNSRLIVRTAGKYEIAAQVQFATSGTGQRDAQIRLNAGGSSSSGTLITLNQQSAVGSGSTSVAITPVEIALAAGDYIEIFARQNSGGALDTVPGSGITFLRFKLTGS